VVAFTGHTVVAADVTPEWIAERIPAGDLGAPAAPPFLMALAERTGRLVGATDALLLAPAITSPAERAAAVAGLTLSTDHGHPRIARALQYRTNVHAYVDIHGAVVVIGQGLADRLECAIELPDEARNQGHGRHLARAARALIPPTTSVWAQITPGNAASLRTFLAGGYKPAGSETLLIR
jgi:hypothetical protein